MTENDYIYNNAASFPKACRNVTLLLVGSAGCPSSEQQNNAKFQTDWIFLQSGQLAS